jgi:hypothetical protein
MSDKCTKMINPHPGVGDINRHPDPRRCTYPEWEDGFCKLHHPQTIKDKEESHALYLERRKLKSKEKAMRNNNGDMPASPILNDLEGFTAFLDGTKGGRNYGLTKREHFALHIYAGLISACDAEGQWTGDNCATKAVAEADNLLTALDNK